MYSRLAQNARERWGESLDFHDFDDFVAGTFDHHGACAANLVRLLKKATTLAAQLRDPGIEVLDARRKWIPGMPARARERRSVGGMYAFSETSPNVTSARGVRYMPSFSR